MRILATRQVLVQAQPYVLPEEFSDLQHDTVLVQGFFIDPSWLTSSLPTQVGLSMLSRDERILPHSAADSILPTEPGR